MIDRRKGPRRYRERRNDPHSRWHAKERRHAGDRRTNKDSRWKWLKKLIN